MGDEYDAAEAEWDSMGRPSPAELDRRAVEHERSAVADAFEVAVSTPGYAPTVAEPDAARQSPETYYKAVLDRLRDGRLRPAAKRGRYYLPHPDTGRTASWQRVTNFIKMCEDTYKLELWIQRNVAKGVAVLALTRPGFVEDLAGRDVKIDKDRLNEIVTRAKDVAEAYKMAEAGTLLHLATEVADYCDGDLTWVLPQHRDRVRLYRDALAVHGITVLPGMIERVVVSARYGTAGTFDRVYGLPDGSNTVGDLKTGDSLDFAFPSIAAQLACYEDGVNNHGVFDGQRYDDSLKVRSDFGIVVHLPSTRPEVAVYALDLSLGRKINAANLEVQNARKIKSAHVATPAREMLRPLSAEELDAYWLDQINGVFTYDELVGVAKRAQSFGQWNDRLAGQARLVAEELKSGMRR